MEREELHIDEVKAKLTDEQWVVFELGMRFGRFGVDVLRSQEHIDMWKELQAKQNE